MTTIDDVADDYVERMARLDPVWATYAGIGGHDDRFGDYSPDGVSALRDLRRSTLAAADDVALRDDDDRVAADLMRERLRTAEALDASEWYRSLNNLSSPFQDIRHVFDLMATATPDDWAAVGARLRQVPAALDGYRRTLEVGVERGATASRRQARTCAQQAAAFAGDDGSGGTAGAAFTAPLLRAHEQAGAPVGDLEDAAAGAVDAFSRFGAWLRDTYVPAAHEVDGVGAERYQTFAAYFTGARLDLDDVEAWGWSEVHRLRDEMADTATRIRPDATVDEVIRSLEQDPEHAITGGEAVIAWLQDLVDETIERLQGTHFSIPEPIRRLEVREAPPGGPPVAYYTGPTEDFSRPGRYWFPVAGRTHFPLWQEVSIAYHEGVPGHHFEIATQVLQRPRLNRFRTTTLISGYSEGWALYAERLMDELGFYTDPAYRLGMLAGQLFRAVRVVVDIGLHTGRRLPDDAPRHAGATWTPDIARDYLARQRFLPDAAVDGEITRYLGVPGQAISYKVGERVWRRVRAELQRRAGPQFSLTDFHARSLALGVMGLDQLERELTRETSAP